jgi:hypothetical protein
MGISVTEQMTLPSLEETLDVLGRSSLMADIREALEEGAIGDPASNTNSAASISSRTYRACSQPDPEVAPHTPRRRPALAPASLFGTR